MLAETLVWTLIHFLWQGVLIGLLLVVVLWFAPADDDVRRSNYRYAAAMLALALVIFAPLSTFCWQWFGQAGVSAAELSDASITVLASIDGAAGWQMPPLLLRCLLAFWAAGVSWFAMKMLMAWMALQYLQRTEVHATPQWVATQVDALVEQMSIVRPVRIIVSGVINTPMTIGWLRPIIILPAALLTSMQIDQLRLLLAHELAHIRRHDYLVNMVQNSVRILLFYHPLVHWICHILDEERELCCDHMAIACSSSRLQYAKVLLSLQDQPHPLPALAAASICKHALLRRIQRILGESEAASQHDLQHRPLICLTSLLVSLAVLVSGFSSIDHSRAAIHVLPERSGLLSIIPARQQTPFLLDELYQRAEAFQVPAIDGAGEPQHIVADLPSLSWPAAGSVGDGVAPQAVSDHAQGEPVSSSLSTMLSPDTLNQQHLQRQQLAMQLDWQNLLNDLPALASGGSDRSAFKQVSIRQINEQAEPLSVAIIESDYSLRADTLPEPVYQASPRVPARMLGSDTVVIVNLTYSVSPSGKPTDILVTEGSDEYEGAFAAAAADALRKWQYPPLSERLQQMRIKQQFVFMQSVARSRCVTGSRICSREKHAVEQVIINS